MTDSELVCINLTNLSAREIFKFLEKHNTYSLYMQCGLYMNFSMLYFIHSKELKLRLDNNFRLELLDLEMLYIDIVMVSKYLPHLKKIIFYSREHAIY